MSRAGPGASPEQVASYYWAPTLADKLGSVCSTSFLREMTTRTVQIAENGTRPTPVPIDRKVMKKADAVFGSASVTGTGMDEETLKHLYEPFFTTKPTGEGTGLGLAAVYGTVKSHRGGIAVTSEAGRGTSFNLLFPLVKREVAAPEDGRLERFDRKHAQVLVIDDDEIVCRMTAILLRELGCTPVICNGGARGVEYYREHGADVDLVIMDMIMPGMGGLETFQALKAIDPNVKVLLASGHSIDGEAQAILDLGAAAFLQKPFELHELSARLSLLLGGSFPTDGGKDPAEDDGCGNELR